MTKPYQRLGVIGRFKPLHKGGAVMLETLCEKADHVIIGIGSSNKYNVRNPFTAEESQAMVEAFLSSRFNNYEILYVPDFAHISGYEDGQQWRVYVKEHFGKLDAFVSGNSYVGDLLKEDYPIIHPADLISADKKIMMRGSAVRLEMARGGDAWKEMVPENVAKYLVENKLINRFRKEFGLQTLIALVDGVEYTRSETEEEEKEHPKEE
ncbi:adenylyltransferase/cytidyltransferase family protein [Candidatus Woesearchaeota archaeon]|nr:adenylyltransferase/cytidyltransferase family protein [Candidatus Woesearchaeota archaeon]